MIFSGIENMGETPFKTVLIHGLVRDEQGRKMSKSLGNGVDPLEVVDEYGADALRFSLVMGVSPGNDTRYSRDKVESARNFANKVWNASRFVLMNVSERGEIEPAKLEIADQWILSRLHDPRGWLLPCSACLTQAPVSLSANPAPHSSSVYPPASHPNSSYGNTQGYHFCDPYPSTDKMPVALFSYKSYLPLLL